MKPFKKNQPKNVPGRRKPIEIVRQPTSGNISDRYAFRRNRTLTGSSSPQVSSSNELNAELRSPRAHVHHLTSLRRRLIFYFSVVVFIAFGCYVVLSQIVADTAVSVSANSSISEEDVSAYSKAIDSYFSVRPIERLRFALDEKSLVASVQAERPEVASMRVEPGSRFGQASVVITPRQPIAKWNMSGSNQYVDESGVVFARNYYDDPGLQIVDNSGIQASSNRLVASNRFLGFVGKVISKSRTNGLVITKVTIPALTTRQISVSLQGKATEYKLSIDRSVGQQVEDIHHLMTYFSSRNMTPEYADVRIVGKAYYR